jgi:hypothetical protein
MAQRDSFSNNNFKFLVGGWDVGYVKSVTPGGIKGDVSKNALGPDLRTKLTIGNFNYEDVTVEAGIGMGNEMAKWMNESFARGFAYQDATLINADFHFNALTEQHYNHCLISEIGIPEMSGAAKTNGYFTIKISPETIRFAKASGKIDSPLGSKAKQWLCCNYRLDGFWGLPLTRVSKIGAMTWKQKVLKDQVGQFVDPTIHPASVETPTMKLTISKADQDPWHDKVIDWFVGGKRREEDEGTGTLTFLGTDMKTELGTLTFENVGISSFTPAKHSGDSESIATFDVELHIEHIKIELKQTDK